MRRIERYINEGHGPSTPFTNEEYEFIHTKIGDLKNESGAEQPYYKKELDPQRPAKSPR